VQTSRERPCGDTCVQRCIALTSSHLCNVSAHSPKSPPLLVQDIAVQFSEPFLVRERTSTARMLAAAAATAAAAAAADALELGSQTTTLCRRRLCAVQIPRSSAKPC
jgi:hypothetical protein